MPFDAKEIDKNIEEISSDLDEKTLLRRLDALANHLKKITSEESKRFKNDIIKCHLSFRKNCEKLKSKQLNLFPFVEGCLDKIELLFSIHVAKDVNKREGKNDFLLERALHEEDLDIVRLLTEEYRANPNVLKGDVPLLSHLIVKGYCEAARTLIEIGNAKVVFSDTHNVLHDAGKASIEYEDIGLAKLVRLCVLRGARANVPDHEGNTPLHLAASSGNVNVVKALMKEDGVDINYRNAVGETPLNHAVLADDGDGESNAVEIVKTLLKLKADPDIPDKKGHTPLMNAAKPPSCFDLARILIMQGKADANIKNKENKNALNYANEALELHYLDEDGNEDGSEELVTFLKQYTYVEKSKQVSPRAQSSSSNSSSIGQEDSGDAEENEAGRDLGYRPAGSKRKANGQVVDPEAKEETHKRANRVKEKEEDYNLYGNLSSSSLSLPPLDLNRDDDLMRLDASGAGAESNHVSSGQGKGAKKPWSPGMSFEQSEQGSSGVPSVTMDFGQLEEGLPKVPSSPVRNDF